MRGLSIVCLVAVCLVALLAGCSSPAVRFHSLPTPAPVDAVGTVTVVVGPLRIPTHLNRPNIAWREGPTRLEFSEDNRWGSTFEAELLRAVTEHVSARMPEARVISWPAEVVGEDSVQVVVEVQQLAAMADGPAYLRARFLARQGVDAKILAESVWTIRATMDGDGARDAVMAYSALAEGLAVEIAGALKGKIR